MLLTSIKTGDAHDPTTWDLGFAPVLDDTCTLANGFTVTIQASNPIVVGDTLAVTPIAWRSAGTGGTGKAVWADGAVFTCHGNVQQGNIRWDIGAGCTLLFKSDDVVGTPAMTWLISDVNNQANTILRCTATAANPTTISSHTAGGKLRFTAGGFLRAGRCEWTGITLTRVGDSGNDAIVHSPNSASDTFFLDDCLLDTCGRINIGSFISNSIFRLERTTCKATASTTCLIIQGTNTVGSGQRKLVNTIFDKTVALNAVTMTVDDCILVGTASAAPWTTSATSSVQLWRNNIVQEKQSPGTTLPLTTTGLWQATYTWYNYADTNPHGYSIKAQSVNDEVRGFVFDNVGGTGSVGDLTFAINPTSNTFRLNYRNCMVVPRGVLSPGTLVSCIGTAGTNTFVSVEHCTYVSVGPAGGECGIKYGEVYAGHAGIYTSLKSNLVWATTAGQASILSRISPSNIQDGVDPATADYNGLWNGRVGLNGFAGYTEGTATPLFSAGTPDVHGVSLSADPFVDRTANVATWDTSLSGAGTGANAFAEMVKRNDRSGFNTAYSRAALFAYFAAKYAVTTASLNNAGHDGVTIGAYGYIAPPASGVALWSIRD